ncbi:MAG: hypothetical protein M3O01_02170, partial [Pseudomonadota bacterium]|nr:hypothetical protein [Pseudomonadota bacterium]
MAPGRVGRDNGGMPSRIDPSRRPIAFTMGDVCGIGPEIVARLFAEGSAPGCVVIGDVAVLRRAVACIGARLAVARIDAAAEAMDSPTGCIPV